MDHKIDYATLAVTLIAFASSLTLLLIWLGSTMNEFGLTCSETNRFGEQYAELVMLFASVIFSFAVLLKRVWHLGVMWVDKP